MTHPLVSQDMIDTYQADGVVLVKGLFADHVDLLRAGVAANLQDPGPYASENEKSGETGRFFDDYCNWSRIPQFRTVIETSAAAEVAADLMQSPTVQVFHDHVLVKEPGTSMATPGTRTGHITLSKGSRPSVSGPPWTRSATRPCAAWRARTFGKKKFCQRAGSRNRVFSPMKANISRFPIRMPKV